MAGIEYNPPQNVNALSGVYEIVCTPTGKRYIGSASKRFYDRFKSHRYLLRRNKHHSIHLQRAWNKHGEEAFTFQPVLLCEPSMAVFFEQRAIDALKPEFNRLPTAGSSLGYKHPPEFSRKCAIKNVAQSKRYLVHGEMLTAKEIAVKYDLELMSCVRPRLRRGIRGDAIAAPAREQHDVLGELLTVREIAEKYNLTLSTVQQRIHCGMTGASLAKPHKNRLHLVRGERLTTGQLAKKYGLDRTTIQYRTTKGIVGEELIAAPHSGTGYGVG